jgi:thioredoxin 1
MKVLYFSSPSCGPCRVFLPIVEEHLKERKIDIEKIDITEESNFHYRNDYGLTSVPTVVVLSDTGEVLTQFSGADPKKLKEII